MAKRPPDNDDASRPSKRPRNAPQSIEEVQSSRQLQILLSFKQDGIQQLRSGISSLKAFLEQILYHQEEGNQALRLSILREYLDSQRPADTRDLDRPFLAQLWQAWRFANQNNNDHLASAVAAILALLAKTLSSLLDFKELGLLFCRTVLQHQHLRLVKRCLNAPKHKEFLISPCLRLLIEVVSFDGGHLAREVYKRREETFETNSLRRNLMLRRVDAENGVDDYRKVAVRTVAVRYVLAHLRYQDAGAKQDILKQRPICGTLFQNIRNDPEALVLELLRTTEQNVFQDAELQRSSKAGLLTAQNLELVLEVATRTQRQDQTPQAAFKWLQDVCSIPSYGVLRSSGWYPPGTDRLHDFRGNGTNAIDLGISSLDFYDKGELQLRNPILNTWIQNLRPQSDLRERELVSTSFKAAPELVAAYFREKKIQLDPKLTNTWIGYASFLFEIVRLPIPQHAGYLDEAGYSQTPPQISIVMESVLPGLLTREVLSRCLRQSSSLVTFIAIRLLVLSFRKLSDVRSELVAGAASSSRPDLWSEATEALEATFMQRCPSMRDVVDVYRRLPDDEEHFAQREATARLLRMYYEVLPLAALEERFEASNSLTASLEHGQAALGGYKSLELEHLLICAENSPNMQWFGKHGSLRFSPAVTLLKLHAKAPQSQTIRHLLSSILVGGSVLSRPKSGTKVSPIDILVASLVQVEGDATFDFLHECFARISKGPIKYQDDLEEITGFDGPAEDMPSLLLAAIVEQAPFASKKEDAERQQIAQWIETFIGSYMASVDSGRDLAAKLWTRLAESGLVKQAEEAKQLGSLSLKVKDVLLPEEVRMPEARLPDQAVRTLDLEAPASEPDNRPELTRWRNKDLDVAIEDGHVGALALCLCSQYTDVRLQGLAQLRLLVQRIEESSLDAKDQLRILLGELMETYERHGESAGGKEALPHIAGVFASRAVAVLTDPTHLIYAKLNRYLMRGPCWNLGSMAAHFVRDSVLSQPDEGDAYWNEVQWVLHWLVDATRTQQDVRLVMRPEVMERLLALYSSPSASQTLVKAKILELVYRTACIDADALVTRVGILGWLDALKGDSDDVALVREHVKSKLVPDRVVAWSGVGLDEI